MSKNPRNERPKSKRSWNGLLFFITIALASNLTLNGLYTYFFVGRWDSYFYAYLMFAHSIVGSVFLLVFLAYLIVHLAETRKLREILAYGGMVLLGAFLFYFVIALSNQLPVVPPIASLTGSAALFLFILVRYRIKIARSKKGPEKKRERKLSLLGYYGFLAFFFGSVLGLLLYIGASDTGTVYTNIHSVLFLALIAAATAHILLYARMMGKNREGVTPYQTVRSFLPLTWTAAAVSIGALGFLPIWIKTAPLDKSLYAGSYAAKPLKTEPLSPSNLHVVPGAKYPESLVGASETCGVGGCHIDIYRQWEMSAHRFANNLFVQRVENLLAEEAGPDAVKICAQCHAPAALLTGGVGDQNDYYGSAFLEGVSCVVCHAVTRRPGETGMGNLDLLPPRVYPFGDHANELTTRLNTRLIEMKTVFHRQAFSKPFYKEADFCGACHRIFIPKEINGVKFTLLSDHLEEWKRSPFKDVSCVECHMPYFFYPKVQRNIRAHLMPGTQQALGEVYEYSAARWGNNLYPRRGSETGPGYQEYQKREFSELMADLAKENEKWMKGEVEIPELEKAGRWKKGRVIELSLKAEGNGEPGSPLKIVVHSSNNKTGHDLPAHPQDTQETWLEMEAKDASGNTVYHSGFLDKTGRLDPEAHRLGIDKTDPDGNKLVRHEVWKIVGKSYERLLKAGETATDEFEFVVPTDARPPITVSARWNYRRTNRDFADFVFEGDPIRLPVTAYSEETLILPSP